MIIYKITNTINGKVYIGQTINTINKRWSGHVNSKQKQPLGNAISKYGKENFTIEKIDSAKSREELNEKEIYWIKFYNSNVTGYNLTSGGSSNFTASDELKAYYSRIRKGKKVSEEQKVKISESSKNRVFTDEHRKNLSKARKDRDMKKETVTVGKNSSVCGYFGVYKISKSAKFGARITVDGESTYIGVYESILEAHEARIEYIKKHHPNLRMKEKK